MADNPNAFKHWIGPALLETLSRELKRVSPRLETAPLTRLEARLRPLELKDRVRLVRDTLYEILPRDYPKALRILLRASKGDTLKGFALWPVTEFVQTYGLDDFDRSMDALHTLTQRFTAEFAVRPFLKRDPERTFAVLERWAADPNHHVRRCASEGSRPRLPWGERIPALIEDPQPGLRVLEKLRFDPEDYVRRSVANHLNDISKDHPEIVCATLARWRRDADPAAAVHLEWTVRHALRGLIKSGHPGALHLVGAGSSADIRARHLRLEKSAVAIGDSLDFSVTLVSASAAAQKLVVDYVIHYLKANGEHGPKVFKLKTFELPPGGTVRLAKRHSLRLITTRVYYPGTHRIGVQVNGAIVAEKRWQLLPGR